MHCFSEIYMYIEPALYVMHMHLLFFDLRRESGTYVCIYI